MSWFIVWKVGLLYAFAYRAALGSRSILLKISIYYIQYIKGSRFYSTDFYLNKYIRNVKKTLSDEVV